MRRFEDDPDTPRVSITCPALDDLAEIVRRHIKDPEDRSECLTLIEVIRTQNRGLRANEEAWRKHARVLRRERMNGLTEGWMPQSHRDTSGTTLSTESSMIDPFVYHPPTEVTAPKYAAIRAAEAEARAAIRQQIGGSWQGEVWTEHAGHYDAQAAYAAISDACRSFYAAILEHAPPSADRAAAERCVRLARMAANEAITTTPTTELVELRRQCVDNLRAARWQACAAIALAGVV